MGRAFQPRAGAATFTPEDGSNLGAVLQAPAFASQQITYKELALFNWGTVDAREVNRALIEQIGCRTIDWANPNNTVLDKTLGPDQAPKTILVPKVWEHTGLDSEQTHVVKVKKVRPVPAVRLEKLDKWFIPGDETCEIEYSLEGIEDRANKIVMDVYASNHCTAAVADNGTITFTADADLAAKPIYHEALNFTERDADHDVTSWQGQSVATAGVLKKRKGDRWINVACSPYTVLMRYYKDDADAEARLDLKPFWPVFNEGEDGTQTLDQTSLEITWEVTKTTKTFTNGQVIIFDKTTEVYRLGLGPAQIAQGKFTWTDGAGIIQLANMPYRAQIQLHTGIDLDDGVALAAMHTEVRLYVHPETGRRDGDAKKDHTKDIWLDKPSMVFAVADYLPQKDATRPAQSISSYKMKLAKAGYYPGPVNDNDDATFKPAWREFQRSYSAKNGGPVYQRLAASDTFTQPVKTALDAGNPKAFPMFGRATDLSDINRTDASRLLNTADPSDAEAKNSDAYKDRLIVWVNDKHYYTHLNPPLGAWADPNLYMGSYHGDMNQISDGKVNLDKASIARPWIPLRVTPLLLSRDNDLDLAVLPDLTTNMTKAIGPLRMDWSFTEAGENLHVFDGPMQKVGPLDPTLIRSRVYVAKTVRHFGALYRGKPAANCKSSQGGLRPDDNDNTSDYHKAVMGFDDASLQPWRASSDGSVIRTVIHDDVGQDAKAFYSDCQGVAGVFLQLSTIAGDGYRFRAQVSFSESGGSAHPNWKVLAKRYPASAVVGQENARLPQALTCRIRIWRRTSIRGHVLWAPSTVHSWLRLLPTVVAQYQAAFVRMDLGDGPVSKNISTLLNTAQVNDVNAYKAIVAGVSLDPYKDQTKMSLDSNYVWPFMGQPHLGVVGVPPPDVTLDQYHTRFLSAVWKDTWLKYGFPLMALVIDRFEKETGRTRGHLIVEFQSSPRMYRQLYQCKGTPSHKNILLDANAGGGTFSNTKCAACDQMIGETVTSGYTCPTCHAVSQKEEIRNGPAQYCDERCNSPMQRVNQTTYPGKPGKPGTVKVSLRCTRLACRIESEKWETQGNQLAYTCEANCNTLLTRGNSNAQIESSAQFWFSALGMPLGGVWLWNFARDDGEDAVTWAHELGHNRHLVHAAGVDFYEYNSIDFKDQHDYHDNANVTDADAKDRQKQWDRLCTMSYQTGKRFLCGRCILKNRGWKVEALPAVAGTFDGNSVA